jgi:hypothetical protein
MDNAIRLGAPNRKGPERVVAMLFQLIVWSFRVLEVMFFTGLIGCSLVVVISWVSIFKDGFSDKDERSSGFHEDNHRQQR